MSSSHPHHHAIPSDSGLDRRSEAFVVAALTTLGPAGVAHCERRSAAAGERARRLAQESALLDGARAALERNPPDLDGVDPSWYSAPPTVSSPAATAWWSRWCYGHLEHPPADATQLTGRALLAALARLGCRRMALAFSAAPRAAVAQLCARVGEPAASQLIDEIRRLHAAADSEDVLDAQRAMADRTTWLFGQERGQPLFWRIGAVWLGATLAHDERALVGTAQRLPRPLGELFIEAARTVLVSDAERALATKLLAEPTPPAKRAV